jgi:hypothetical protein
MFVLLVYSKYTCPRLRLPEGFRYNWARISDPVVGRGNPLRIPDKTGYLDKFLCRARITAEGS